MPTFFILVFIFSFLFLLVSSLTASSSAWSLATGSLPQSSCFPHLPPKPTVIDDIEASLWIPYTDDGTYNSQSFIVLLPPPKLPRGSSQSERS